MRAAELAKRNLQEVWRDWLSLGLIIGLPLLLLPILQAFERVEDFFSATVLVPGIVLFSFVMLMFSAAMTLARDRESALFARLLTAPLRSNDFVAAYSLPYLPVAIVQTLLLFGLGALLGLQIAGDPALVALVLLTMAVFYVGLGMILGSVMSYRAVPAVYALVLLLTIFGGAWMDLEAIGGLFQSIGDALPFAHALYATRSVTTNGAQAHIA